MQTQQTPSPSSSPFERAVAAALEDLAQQAQQALFTTQDPAERRYWKRAMNAYNKALSHWLAGVRLTETPAGGYLVPSGTRGGVVHRLWLDGDWRCTCEAGQRDEAHWHTALAHGIERASEADAGDDDEAPPVLDELVVLALAQRRADEAFREVMDLYL